jgi:hypothetical protein
VTVGETELRRFVEELDSRLVGRTSASLGRRFDLTPEEVRLILQTCPNVEEAPKGLWTYERHIEPVRYQPDHYPEIKAKPKTRSKSAAKPSLEPAPETPPEPTFGPVITLTPAPVDSPFRKWER